MKLIDRRSVAMLLIGAAALPLAGCVGMRVSSKVVTPDQPPLERLVIVIPTGGAFKEQNTAARTGQRNLDMLLPQLSVRLPAVFAQNGLPARSVIGDNRNGPLQLRLEAGEKLLFVTPVSASSGGRGGAGLVVKTRIVDPHTGKPVWDAEVHMEATAFGKYDESVANHIAVQLLDKLSADGLLRQPAGTVRKAAL